jgi:lysophospholipase L1-like esterase
MKLPLKTSLAILTFAILIFAAGFIPGLSRAGLRAGTLRAAVGLRREIPQTPAKAPLVAEIPKPPVTPMPFLMDPNVSLRPFYEALVRTESGGGVTRVLHYGDSPVTADSITADMRSMLQQRFGDAGHGFVLIAKPWAWYGHRGVALRASGWRIYPASQSRAHDGLHGLGGVSFEGKPGAWSRFNLDNPNHTQLEISFLRQPGGGSVAVQANDADIGEVATDGESKTPDFARVPLPPGSKEIAITVRKGPVRLFGVSFEKEGPGIVYNSLGLNGGQVQVVVRYFDKQHWAAQLQHQHPDLVIINYGTNESVFPSYIDRYYADELREVLRRVRAAVPNAALLVMAPMDRGERDATGEIVTVPILPHVVDIQRKVALESGWAFFNTFEAMGGEGTMARWYVAQPRLVTADFMHPLPGGAKRVGTLLDEALLDGFARYKAKQAPAKAAAKP